MCGRTDFPGVVTTVLDGFNAGATEKSHSTPSNLETPSLNASFPDTIASDLLTSVYPICDEFQDFRASFSVKDNLKSDEAPTAQGQSCVIEPRDDPSCKLFVGQVPRTWKEATLRSIFSTCGMVTDVQIMRDARGGSNGCAWVTYHSQKEAETAIRLIHGHEIQCDTNARENKILQVRFATPKHPHHPKPEEKVKPSTFGWEKTLQQHYTAGIGNKQYENFLTAPVHIHTSAIPSITHVPVSDSSAQWITLASLPQSYALQPNTTLPPANTFSVLQPNFASSNGMVQQVSFVGSNPQYMTPYASLIPVPVQAPTTLLHSSNSPNGVAVSCVCSPVSTLSNPTQIASPLNSRPMPFQGAYSAPNPIMSHWTPAPASVLNQQNILQPISQTEHPMMISTYIVPVTNCGPVPGIDPTNAITKAQLGCTLRGEPFDANDKNQHQIFVTRLIPKADEGHLRRVLERYGPIAKVKFLEDGVAVSYHTKDAAERTLLDPHLVQEWCLKAEIETQQDECKLFIGMIPFTVCEESLRKLFEQFGTVLEVHIIRAEQGESRGAAFVRFQNPESAARAKQQLHGSNILTTSCFQHPMTVQIAKVTKKSRRRQKQNKLKHKESVKIIDALYSSEISTTGCSVDEELDASDSNSVSVTQRPLEKGVHPKLVKKGTAKGAASTELDCKSCKATIISDPPHCGPEGANLFIRNLSRDTNEDNLRTLFEPFGTLLSATVFRDVRTGRSRGFGFVSFSSVEEAVKAIAQLHGFMMNGRALQVEPKKQNTTRSDTDRGVADEVPNDLATIPPLIHPRGT